MSSKITVDPASLQVWDENIGILRTQQPFLARKLEEWIRCEGRVFEHTQTAADKGLWIEGLTPEPFFQSHAFPPLPWKKANQAEDNIFFVYGTGAVPWLFTLFRSLPAGLLAVVVIEPSLPLLAYTLHTTRVYRLIPESCRLVFLASDTQGEVEEALRYGVMALGGYAAVKTAVYSHPGEMVTAKEAFIRLQAAMHVALILQLQQKGNSLEDTLLGVRQTALLSPWVALGAKLDILKNAYKGRPFVWVASGPSLDINFRLLRNIQDRAVIVCADTAAGKLLQSGITPHIIVALERGRAVFDYLEKLFLHFPEQTAKILLVAQAVCVPQVAGRWPGPRIILGKAELALDRWLVRDVLGGDVLVSGLSVAHMGIWLASLLGASSIALLGQDLAFAPDRTSHASGTVSSEGARIETEGDSRILKGIYHVPSVSGGSVETHEMWRLFLGMLERYIPFLSCPLFDCTEGGALIQGTQVLAFAEWQERYLFALSPFEHSPSVLVERFQLIPEERLKIAEETEGRVVEALRVLDASFEELEQLAALAKRVASAGISENRRRRLAEEVYRAVDTFNRRYPVMDFIGQGFAAVNALKVIKNRRLESSLRAAEWHSAFEDLFCAYRLGLSALKYWITYMGRSVKAIAERWGNGFQLSSFSAAGLLEIKDSMKEVLLLSEQSNEAANAFVLLDNLLARIQPEWWRQVFFDAEWRIGLVLERQERIGEANSFLNAFEPLIEKLYPCPSEKGCAFYTDRARILMKCDWAGESDLEAAEKALKKACDYAGEGKDGDTRKNLKAAIEQERSRRKRRTSAALSANQGEVYFDYVPHFVLDDVKRMVEEIIRLAAAAFYNKNRVLDFSQPARCPTHRQE